MESLPPKDESARLEALYRYRILDTSSEEPFDELARLAAEICGMPIALISLLDRDRQWFKSKIGLSLPQTPRALAFYSHVIQEQDLLVVPDTLADKRFARHPLVTAEPHIRCFAEALLITPGGMKIGALCVMDQSPRTLHPRQINALQVLSRQVIAQMELRRLVWSRVSGQAAQLEAANDQLKREVAERKQAEQALHESEERYRFLTRATNDIIWDWNLLTGEVVWSDNLQKVLGYSPDVPGKSSAEAYRWWVERIHPDDRERIQTVLDRLLSGEEEVCSTEYRFRRADGSYIVILDRGYIVRNERKALIRMVGSMLDVTEQRRAEEALRRKTIEAEEASRLKSKFVSIVSHELRTPLNAIIGYAALLKYPNVRENDNKVTDMLDRIGRNARRMLGLINGLLDLSKIEAKQMTIRIETLSLFDLIGEVVNDLRLMGEEKGLAFHLIDDPAVPPICSDSAKLRQIFTNLIANAIKFTEKGSITIRLFNRARQEEVRVELSDTGIGMRPEQLSRIFEPFYRADLPEAQSHSGTGLGLSIVKKLIDLLNGHIDIASRPNEGTTVTLCLPYALREEEPGRPLF